ncbi:hypothetical protein [Mucilaginibacter agri]|uniref:Uncharacterized protein n=1 Tax=Mucilaginibacter agri TaxID=2695265 RepID=A0A965ZFT9_9SPHI|nr:hypothetical protein [Mucilaginibacter agri]NCD69312.1 hypothetical protein [Mucilaginibacter agri]
MDQYAQRMYEMKLTDIYNNSSWIPDEISLPDFIALFPVEFKNDVAIRPDKPKDFDLDRDTYLAIMVAFRQAFS